MHEAFGIIIALLQLCAVTIVTITEAGTASGQFRAERRPSRLAATCTAAVAATALSGFSLVVGRSTGQRLVKRHVTLFNGMLNVMATTVSSAYRPSWAKMMFVSMPSDAFTMHHGKLLAANEEALLLHHGMVAHQ
jgi:hypothetical protein